MALLGAAPLLAQAGLHFEQLRDLLRSSVNQGLRDKDVAKYLRGQKLTFSISDRLLEEFQGYGVGPKTLEELRKLQTASAALPSPDEPKKVEPAARRQPPPPSEEEQKRIIEQARSSALAYTETLPDFICLQLTRRYLDPSGLEMDWLKYDEMKTRVSYVEGHENYELISINDRTTKKSLDQVDGATSTGEFGSILSQLFSPLSEARFTWARHSLLRGRPVYVFHFRVRQNRSRWRLHYQDVQEIIAGYGGLVYIDRETERVLRIRMAAEEIPVSFPIREARTTLDYDFIDISGIKFLLPLKARVRMRESRMLSRNDVEFRLYRKFSAEAVISFDEIDDIVPLPDEPEDEPGEASNP